MCYDVRYLTKKPAAYKRRYAGLVDAEEIKRKMNPANHQTVSARFHSNGFSHDPLPVVEAISNEVRFFSWGLIPRWIKSSEEARSIQNQTLNARGEELFEKPSFKDAAATRRCLVLVDGYFEHHHRQGKTFPYHIQMMDKEPMSLAGLWSSWLDTKNGVEHYSVTIVTTKGNQLMSEIHNNPKLAGPRMPVILDKETEKNWIADDDFSQKDMDKFLRPYPSENLHAYSVRPLRGRNGVGNREEAIQVFPYPELQKGLFDM
ncbi:MAG: SOS response-associated peptidase [Cyclobacteriaceae bacterium]